MMTESMREPVIREQTLAAVLPGLVAGEVAELKITGVQQDSRLIRQGDLFLACAGAQAHGLKHIEQARAQGAVAVAWEPDGHMVAPSNMPAFEVPGLTSKLGAIASSVYEQPSRALLVVGITGTDGKTSCAWILAQALDRLGLRCGYLGTLGYGFADRMEPASHTTPDAVRLQYWLAKLRANKASAVALEVSSHALQQGRVSGVAFDLAVLTNVGRDHLDYHGDEASYAAAKRRLFEMPGLRAAVLNQDDACGRQWLAELPTGVAGIAYGLGGRPDAAARRSVLALDVQLHAAGLTIEVESSWGCAQLNSQLLGRFNAYNLLACLSVLLEQGVEMDAAIAALAEVPTVPGRMQAITGSEKQPLVVVDYAHTPQALEQALHAARAHCSGRLISVFGCGGDRDAGKRPLMARAAAQFSDAVIVTDDNPRSEAPAAIVSDIVAGLPAGCDYCIEHDRAAAIALAIARAGVGDVVLIAGKGHEDYQIVGAERRYFSDQVVVRQVLEEGSNGSA